MHIDIRCVLCASEWVSVFYGHMYEPERAAYAIFIWMWNEFCPCCFHKILVALHLHWPTEPVDLWFFDWQNSNTKRNLRNYWYLIALIWWQNMFPQAIDCAKCANNHKKMPVDWSDFKNFVHCQWKLSHFFSPVFVLFSFARWVSMPINIIVSEWVQKTFLWIIVVTCEECTSASRVTARNISIKLITIKRLK